MAYKWMSFFFFPSTMQSHPTSSFLDQFKEENKREWLFVASVFVILPSGLSNNLPFNYITKYFKTVQYPLYKNLGQQQKDEWSKQ